VAPVRIVGTERITGGTTVTIAGTIITAAVTASSLGRSSTPLR
jgi:hypothetical protein